MRDRFRRWMTGRYGSDAFNYFLSIAALVLFFVGLFLWRSAYYFGLAALCYSYFRMFSRNIPRRRRENAWYLRQQAMVQQWWGRVRQRFDKNDPYRYFSCPRCRQELRVPKGRGRISINCPKCGTQFIRKS